MANTTRDLLNIPVRSNDRYAYPMLAGIRLFKRAIMAVTAAGFAVPASHEDAVAIVGLVELHVDNRDGVDGAEHATAERGCFGYQIEVDEADIGRTVYAADDQTPTLDGSDGRLPMGVISGISDGRAWIDIPAVSAKPVMALPVRIATLVGATTTRIVAPIAGRIARISSVIDGVLTTGNATVQATVNGVAVTDGLITIAQAGSAAGDVHSAVPTDLNEVAAGDVIGLTVGGTNATATPATIVLEIAP